MELRQGLRVGCSKEIAFRSGYIAAEQLFAPAGAHEKSGFRAYLRPIYEAERKGV